MQKNIEELKIELDEVGFVVIKNAISADTTDLMAKRLMEILANEPNRDNTYQNRQGLLNYDLCFLPLLQCEIQHQLNLHVLGGGYRFGETGTVYNKPGGKGIGWHADVPLGSFGNGPFPEVNFILNSIWMLTDFTAENGATRVIPFSHKMRRGPRADFDYDKYEVVAEAPKGSVVVFHGAVWHRAGTNMTIDKPRLGVSVVYHHRHLDGRSCGWDPIHRTVFNRLPAETQKLIAPSFIDETK